MKNTLISLSNVVCEALQLGMSVDLAELGSLRLIVSSKMMDTLEKVIDRPKKETASGGTTTEPGSGNEGSFG